MSQSSPFVLGDVAPNRRHAWYAAILVAAAMSVMLVVAAVHWEFPSGGILNLPILILATPVLAWAIAFVLMARGRFEVGIEIALIVMLIAAPLTSFWIEGYGLIFGIGCGLGVLFVATLALPPSRAQWFVVLAVFSGLATVALDEFGPPERADTTFAIVPGIAIIVLLFCFLAVFVLANFKAYPLRIKLLLAFVTLALIAVGGVTLIATQAIHSALTQNVANDLQTRAQAAAVAVGITMDRNVDRLSTLSLDKRVQDDVTIITDSYPFDEAERNAQIQRNAQRWANANAQESLIRNVLNGQLAYSLRQFGDVFLGNKELFITDAYGSLIAATDWRPEYNFGDNGWWKAAYNNGRGAVYVGQPEFDPMLNEYGIRIAVPIYAQGRQRAVGVLHSIYTMTAMQRVLVLNSFGSSGKIDLLFPQGEILTSDGTFRSLTFDEFTQVKDAIGATLPTLTYRGEARLSSQGVIGTSDEQPEPYLRASAWRTIATIEPEEALLVVEAGTRAALLAGILAIGAAIVVALLLAQFLTQPIRRLTAVAEQIQAGDLAARAPVDSTDEIGALAATFNNMTARLQDTLIGLERRVAERTQELSNANLTLQSNSAYLSALSDTSTGLFERQSLNDLLQATVERAGALMGTQHGFVFFQQAADEDIVMRVGTGLYDDLVGTHAQRGIGLAGTVWQTGEPMTIDDYQKWEGRLPGSRRDALRAIVGVPLKRGAGKGGADNETVGVIGLAYTDAERKFGKTEVEILERFAQLASIALDNAQLYATSENRVQELAALNSISQILAQETDLPRLVEKVGAQIAKIFDTDSAYVALYDANAGRVEFPYVLDAGERVEIAPLPYGQGLTSQVLATAQPMLLNVIDEEVYKRVGAAGSGEGAPPASLLSVPLAAGERVLGVLNVQRLGAGRDFTPEDQRLLTTIAASVAVGIENTRLAQATQRQLAELGALNRTSAILTSVKPLTERLSQIGRELQSIFGVSSVYIALYDAATNLIEMPFFHGDGQAFAIEPYTLGPGFTSHIIQTRQPLMINDDIETAMMSLHAMNAGEGDMTQSYLGVPVILGDQVLGVIGLSDQPKNRFQQSDVRLLSTIASAVASAIQNARLLEQTRNALAETQRLAAQARESAEQVTALNRRLTREGWRDYLAQLNSRVVVEAGTGEDGNGHVSALSDPNGGSNHDDADNEHKVQVPILLRGEVIGEIELEPDETTNALSDEDMGLITHVAENIGLALDNARLYTETQRRVTELDALNRISQAVTTELDLESLLNVIGEQVRQIFDVQNVYIALYDKGTQLISLPYFINDNRRVQVEPIRFGEGISSEIIRTRRPLLINQASDEKMAELGAKVFGNPARSYLGVPILVGEEVTGVISIQNTTREGMFNESSVRLLETIAATVGTAIQNAQLYGAMQQEVLVRQRAEEEIKLSLKEKEVLLKEIHHRVKNNLQIITSLLNLQSAQIKDAETLTMFRESQARVRSMALIHEKLYQSKDLARIDFDGYVRDLMVYLFRSYAANPDLIQTEIDTSNMHLGIDAAIPCGLIISELVTNSMKYAFPNGRRGKIYIGLHPHDDGNLTLEVSDNGIGFTDGFDWRESDSLGLQLVSTLTSQLHGTIEVNGKGGASFKLTFPG
jgi:GAF domain-containing protein/HAMP domain-containing protein